MSILVDSEIAYYLNRLTREEGGVEIDPMEDPKSQIQPASVDLRLGNDFAGISNGSREMQSAKMMLSSPQQQHEHLQKKITIDPRVDQSESLYIQFVAEDDQFIVVPPMTFLLGTTKERVYLPPNIVGRVEGKSSFARLGVAVHSTAGFIDPGFDGQITLEIFNHSPRPVKLYIGDPICQLVLEKTATPAERPYGHPSRSSKYQGQTGTTVSRIHQGVEYDEE